MYPHESSLQIYFPDSNGSDRDAARPTFLYAHVFYFE